MNFADQFADWLQDEGYTHCFFVAGGNIMHLLNSVRTRMTCIPVVHEVAAGIAAEYFNEVAAGTNRRAFALVTAGPGVTNVITAVAAAYAESRELLVVGGQVKSSDLATDGLRQRGIQEVDGLAIMEPLCVATMRLESPRPRREIAAAIRRGGTPRKGPVYIEFCLDAQAAAAMSESDSVAPASAPDLPLPTTEALSTITACLQLAERPVVLIGGGVDRAAAQVASPALARSGLPVMTTWNGADRVDSTQENYWGRPNTWGMRHSNILLQQADLIIALGTRLGLQQTGFNWEQFAPLGKVIHIDLDPKELTKGHPRIDYGFEVDATAALIEVCTIARPMAARWAAWRDFGRDVIEAVPTIDQGNTNAEGYVDPFVMGSLLSELCEPTDVIIPGSSGGAYTSMMQTFRQRGEQILISDKGMASMGYGLSGAIGAASADRERRVILVEGDGGFAQNLQELGTVRAQNLNLKAFIYCNQGYASIRMTQRNYFGGAYVGCDTQTGLGIPDWSQLCAAYSLPCIELDAADPLSSDVRELLDARGPAVFLVPIDPEQTYFPKIASRVTATGGMESNPLHLMSPALESAVERQVMKHLPPNLRSQNEQE